MIYKNFLSSMQPHEKSVKLFDDCLFLLSGSRKPFLSNKHEQFTLAV